MCLPALRLLEASGYTPALVGKRWAEDLLAGMGWRFDPIEGHILEDLQRIRYLAKNTHAKRGFLFPNSLGSALLFKIGQLQTAGLTTDCRSVFLDTKIPVPKQMHEVERFFYTAHEAIKAWGGTPAWDSVPKNLGLLLLKRHEAAARNLMEKQHIPQRFALLAPVARGLHNGTSKAWPHFNALCQPLRDLGIEPIVFPSAREVEEARKACPNATILPPVALGTFAAIAKKAQLVVANDSGVSHIAAGLGVKQITLIGVTDPTRTSPWSPRSVLLGKSGQWPEVDEVTRKISELCN